MHADYPLAALQREVLGEFDDLTDGEILAVNGPPGTGKTTLIQSIIAHEMVKRCVADATDPILVFATSQNNQAVQNIIGAFSSFAKDCSFHARWLPEVHSLGIFGPSTKALKQIANTNGHLMSTDNNGWGHLPARVHTKQYLNEAREYFLSCYNKHKNTKDSTLANARDTLREDVASDTDQIKNIRDIACQIVTCQGNLITGSIEQDQHEADKEAEHGHDLEAQFGDRISAKRKRRDDATATLQRIEETSLKCGFLADTGVIGFVMRLFPTIRAKRWSKARTHIRSAAPDEGLNAFFDTLTPPSPAAIRHQLDASYSRQKRHLKQLERDLIDLESARSAEIQKSEARERRIRENVNRVLELQRTLHKCLNHLSDHAAKQVTKDKVEKYPVAIADEILDVTLRHRAFLNATHYWEARFLLEVERLHETYSGTDLHNEVHKPGRKRRQPMLRRMAMITPCMVSTVIMLPKWLSYRHPNGAGQFRSEYMFGEIDLLIVDEAGQVTPSTGGLPFALAKRALVVGDINQIEPIYDLPKSIDEGNLNTVVSSATQNHVRKRGLKASDAAAIDDNEVPGNLMNAAQGATRTTRRMEEEKPQADGLFLEEHRRCPDTIIGISNDLIYKRDNQPLITLKGDVQKGYLPLVGWAMVNGRTKRVASSYRNDDEAAAIAKWLKANRERIETEYGNGERLESLVAVITPYKWQKFALFQALKAQNINTGQDKGITVGTIHALQGAECPIVILSTTVTTKSCVKRPAFDQKPNMLNVAVSRAKESFLVFGDADMFQDVGPSANRPSSILARRMFAAPSNEITDIDARPELLHGSETEHVRILEDAEAHDELLQRVVREEENVLIVSPWISRSAIQDSGFIKAVQRRSRSKGVTVVCDGKKNRQLYQSNFANYQKVIEELHSNGIEVIERDNTHAKTLAAGQRVYVEGSFNWLSAPRDRNHQHHSLERSIQYTGPKVCDFIKEAHQRLMPVQK